MQADPLVQAWMAGDPAADEMVRLCLHCVSVLPVTDFAPSKRRWPSAHCRACLNERGCTWAKNNPERHRERNRTWCAANREKAREAVRAYYAANPEKVRERVRTWQKANPEKVREAARARRAVNPGKERAKEARRRARGTLGSPKWDLTNPAHVEAKRLYDAEMAEIYTLARAFLCDVDHGVPLAGCIDCGAVGLHAPANLRVMAPEINYRKGQRCGDCWQTYLNRQRQMAATT